MTDLEASWVRGYPGPGARGAARTHANLASARNMAAEARYGPCYGSGC